jgi:hypothetical protein
MEKDGSSAQQLLIAGDHDGGLPPQQSFLDAITAVPAAARSFEK